MQVLVVEDDLLLADCLAETLQFEGHFVCGIATTVAQGVALARQHHPDIGIFDMNLGGIERGSDVVIQLAASGDLRDTGILYVTGEPERVLAEVTVGHACLTKPYRFATLTAALEIVREVARDGGTSRPLPRGLQLLPAVVAQAEVPRRRA
ncbi:MAG TPA: response regulator [Rhodopila sp.]